MAATAAALSTKIQIREDADELIAMTRWPDGNDTDSIDSTVLEEYCQMAIDEFENEFENYDPDNFNWHYTAAHYKCMQMLFARMKDFDRAKEYEDKLAPFFQRKRAARNLRPKSSQSFDNATAGSRAPMNDSDFNGVVGDTQGGATDF